MGVLYLTRNSDVAREEHERLAEVARASEESDDYGVVVANKLLRDGGGNVVVSPESYKELNDPDRLTIQSLVAERALDPELKESIDRLSSKTKGRRR